MKILFSLTTGTNSLVQYRLYDDLLNPSDTITSLIVSDCTITVSGDYITIGAGINPNTFLFSDVLKAGLVPATSPADAKLYLDDIFATYITASRGSGGGGGGGDASAANQTTQIGIANATNALLTEIRDDARLQIEFSESIWIDATQTYFIRRITIDETTGTETIVSTLFDGTPYIPTAPEEPAISSSGEDIEFVKTTYLAINSGVGYNIDDVVTQVKLVQTVSPFSVIATVYFNNTTNTVITPDFADLQLYSEFVNINNQVVVFSGIDTSNSYPFKEIRTYAADGTFTQQFDFYDQTTLTWTAYTPDPADLVYDSLTVNSIRLTLSDFYNAFGNITSPPQTNPSINAPLISYVRGLLENSTKSRNSAPQFQFYKAIGENLPNYTFDNIISYTRHFNYAFDGTTYSIVSTFEEWRNVTTNTVIPAPNVYNIAIIEEGNQYNTTTFVTFIAATNDDLSPANEWEAGNIIEKTRFDVFNGDNTGANTTYYLYQNLSTGNPILDATALEYLPNEATANQQIEIIGYLEQINDSLAAAAPSKLERIQKAPDYSQDFTYHNPLVIGSNVLSITHTGTTALGVETVLQTFTYVDPAQNGSNVTNIQLS
jgi:hypothetical protein